MHEEKSVDVARSFLSDKELRDETRQSITDCIMATKMPVHPSNILEEIICDADTYHVGTAEFFTLNKFVLDEMEARFGIKVIDRVSSSLQFLESHQFYTAYCQQKLQAGKEENIRKLRSFL
ncbi:MAG: hypothetical protein EOO01_10095 [Chitinophagaceae bacterium]|nr:MAG: hypothetical protein EOO01_10095 [Chitinophagaceae bacterium]